MNSNERFNKWLEENLSKYSSQTIKQVAFNLFKEDFDFNKDRLLQYLFFYQKNKYNRENDYIPFRKDLPVDEPFIFPIGGSPMLVLADLHSPFTDRDKLDMALERGYKEGIKSILLLGDTCDFWAISRYDKVVKKVGFKEELDITKQLLSYIRTLFDSSVPIYFKIGNHEERLVNYLARQAPEMQDLDSLDIRFLLDFVKYNLILIEGKQLSFAGNMGVLHGHELPSGMSAPVNPAQSLFRKVGVNCIMGHVHTPSSFLFRDLNNNITSCHSLGTLGCISKDYMPITRWVQGFGILEYENDDSHLQNLYFDKNKIKYV